MVDRDLLDEQTVARLRTHSSPDISIGDGKPETVLKSMTEELELPPGFASEGDPTKLDDGRTVYMFTRPERFQPIGLSHQGDQLEVELRSGLSATFDESGQLQSYFYTPVGDEERQDAEMLLNDLMKRDRVKEDAFGSQTENRAGRVFLGRLVPDREGVKVFERIPVFD